MSVAPAIVVADGTTPNTASCQIIAKQTCR